MSYNEASQFPGRLGIGIPEGPPNQPFSMNPFADAERGANNGFVHNNGSRRSQPREQDANLFHGEALARDAWAERTGPWLVLGFSAAFSLFLIGMVLIGQAPGKSFTLKSASDIFQFVGEGIGFLFCARIALRLRLVSTQLRRDLMQQRSARLSPNELATAHNEAQVAHRAFMAWGFLAVAIALYAMGQAVWTSYDIRMNSADVPFPGIYDIGFVASYPFFLIGTLMLTRRNKASVGRVRLILDALAIIGTALALSWFFLLSPLIASFAHSPSTGADILSVYFPTGDLFLVTVGAILMFSPLAHRAQQPVFMLLCMGLFFLAVTDSLLSYYSLSSSFNTGTLQDVLWPLSLSLIGLAAVEYPRSIAREQEQNARLKQSNIPVSSGFVPTRLTQLSLTAQTIAPFILVLGTCAILLTNIASRGGATLIQADVVALLLILVVIVRQAMTLLENNRLTMQMRGELVISRRELQVTRREADEATRSAQDKQAMEQGIAALREVHARVARGDIIARAPTVPGPLLPIAISLNLMLDRIGALSQRGAKYDQLAYECRVLQEGVERIGQGLPPFASDQQMPQAAAELRSAFLGLAHVQRIQESQWRRVNSALEAMSNLTHRIAEALNEIKHSHLFRDQSQATFERMVLDRVVREVDLLEQQQTGMLSQISNMNSRNEAASERVARPAQSDQVIDTILGQQPAPRVSQPTPSRYDGHNPYSYRIHQGQHLQKMRLEE